MTFRYEEREFHRRDLRQTADYFANPSFEARPNGKPPGPGRWYAVHFHRPGPGGLPSVPPQLER
jgi:hypothetical protein